jgi:hypothetical protein
VKLIAKMKMSSTILQIYQSLTVEFQTARAEQIYFTNRRFVTILHHFLLLIFFNIPPPSPPLSPLSLPSSIDSGTGW